MQGKCVEHEVDVLAKRPGRIVVVECKFHKDPKAKTAVQVPLYIQSRFKDIEAQWRKENPNSDVEFIGHVVTNTRFTLDAMNFAKCAGLGMISWDYPKDRCLKTYIDLSGLHPVTSLHSLRRSEQKLLLDKGIVLSSELEANQALLLDLKISPRRIKTIVNEAKQLIQN